MERERERSLIDDRPRRLSYGERALLKLGRYGFVCTYGEPLTNLRYYNCIFDEAAGEYNTKKPHQHKVYEAWEITGYPNYTFNGIAYTPFPEEYPLFAKTEAEPPYVFLGCEISDFDRDSIWDYKEIFSKTGSWLRNLSCKNSKRREINNEINSTPQSS